MSDGVLDDGSLRSLIFPCGLRDENGEKHFNITYSDLYRDEIFLGAVHWVMSIPQAIFGQMFYYVFVIDVIDTFTD